MRTKGKNLFILPILTALFLSPTLSLPAPSYALRTMSGEGAGAEEIRRKITSPTKKAGLEESDEEVRARPMRIRFKVRPGVPVEADLPTGEKIKIHIKTKGANQGRVVIPQPRGYITYRERSLRPGAVWNYTLYKTKEKILPLKRKGDRGYERRVDEGLYFFPVALVEDLLGRNASPQQWRVAAPYVFWESSRNSDGSVVVEMHYREPATSSPQAGLEERGVQRVSIEEFLGTLTPEQRNQVPAGAGQVLVASKVHVYAQGEPLVAGLEEKFQRTLPPDLRSLVALIRLPLPPGERYQRPGIILEDKGLGLPVANPLDLPRLELWLIDLQGMDARKIQGILQWALSGILGPNVQVLGIMVYDTPEGRKLAIFV